MFYLDFITRAHNTLLIELHEHQQSCGGEEQPLPLEKDLWTLPINPSLP